MAKKDTKTKVPKRILGFKLSKGTRKDLKRLLRMFGDPDTHKIAIAAASGLAAFLADRFAEPAGGKRGKAAKAPVAH